MYNSKTKPPKKDRVNIHIPTYVSSNSCGTDVHWFVIVGVTKDLIKFF